ncbi:MAG: E3 ubiquitin ligase family protein [Oscillospiraceae bacterium]|jgi:hypothetical protein|nr:E3 ubiquitin ligase family protein [Oscillospiraceae bacterium]
MHPIQIVAILLIIAGPFCIFYIRPKMNNRVTEMKFMQTKTIAELRKMFAQMGENGLQDSYREYVELKGSAVCDQPVETPFSNQQAVYCESQLSQVTEQRERYRDSDGHWQERMVRRENIISNEKSSQYISMKDSSGDEKVVLEINAPGCSLDVPQTFDRFEPRGNLSRYRFFNSFSFGGYGADTLGFRMKEKIIRQNQQLYVLGEAYLSGDEIHVSAPNDKKQPFLVTTKSEDDMVKSNERNSQVALIGGIVSVVLGVLIFFL